MQRDILTHQSCHSQTLSSSQWLHLGLSAMRVTMKDMPCQHTHIATNVDEYVLAVVQQRSKVLIGANVHTRLHQQLRLHTTTSVAPYTRMHVDVTFLVATDIFSLISLAMFAVDMASFSLCICMSLPSLVSNITGSCPARTSKNDATLQACTHH